MSQLAESVDTSVPTVGTGFSGWLSHIRQVLSQLPDAYRSRLQRKRRQTIIVTILALLGLTYPVIHQYVLAGFSRNVFPLPLPDDTVMTFMMIFSIMAVGLNIVAGFAGLLDLGYVAFYGIGAYVYAFLDSGKFGTSVLVTAQGVDANESTASILERVLGLAGLGATGEVLSLPVPPPRDPFRSAIMRERS